MLRFLIVCRWLTCLLLEILIFGGTAYLIDEIYGLGSRDPVPYTETDLECATLNAYFEARGEGMDGMRAVTHVVVNRKLSSRFPSSLCEVVMQGGEVRHQCQFTWYCDGRSDVPEDKVAWKRARRAVLDVLEGRSYDWTYGATHYRAINIAPPYWEDETAITNVVAGHVFSVRARTGEEVQREKEERSQKTFLAKS